MAYHKLLIRQLTLRMLKRVISYWMVATNLILYNRWLYQQRIARLQISKGAAVT